MSSKRKPRQILGMNNSKLESDMGMGRTFGYNGNNNQNEKPDATNLNWEYHHNFSNEFNSTSVTNDSVLCSKNENENKFFLNQSKEAVAMNLENVNRIRLEEMASYWPYAQFISPFCAPPTYGIISSGPGVTYHQVPYFPANPAMPATTYENRNQFSSDSNECSSSNGTNSNTSSAPSIKLPQNISLKCEDNNGNVNASGIILNQKQFVELTRLAMRGSETAERIAYTHRNRPCFKKIDSLCARMKQDLIRPDGVLPNINSQGIAWAVKDFIFVFTRVINAWIIIKGYVYNTPEGLNKIKAALSSDFLRSFAAWQDTTMDFVENLIKSFVNLDQLVQSQKTPFQKSENISKSSTSSTPIKSSNQNLNFESNENFDESFDFLNLPTENILTPQATGTTSVTSKSTVDNVGQTLNKSYYSTLIEDSEESQRKATVNGTYFKTGVYNPIWKDSISEMDPLYFPGKKDSIDPILENLPLASTLEKVLPITFGTTNAVEDLVWSSQQNTTISLFSPTENSNVPNNNGSNNVSASNGNISANNNGSNSNNNNNGSNSNNNNNNNNNNSNNNNNNNNNSNNNNTNNNSNNNNNNNTACTSHQNTNNLSNNNSDISNISYCAPINGEGDGKLFDLTRNISTGQIPKNCFSYDLKVLEKNVSKFSNSFDPTVTKPIGQDTVKKLEILLKKIQNLPEGNLFFEERFMKNYFPDFMSKSPKFLDLRSIFLKAQVGGYAHINEFVQDLKLISQYVNIYLKGTKHEMLESAINKYDSAINKILKEEIFKECNFDFKTEVTPNNNSINNNNNI